MMPSRYITIARLSNDEVLLYNTFNTSMVVLAEKSYERIFVERNYEESEFVTKLYELGFLVDGNSKQLEQIEGIRKQSLFSGEQIVNIFSTNNCNARCYYCFENGIDMVDMSEKTADETIKFILKFYRKKQLKIIWFGGEPLLNFPIIDRITTALKGYGYTLSCHVTTNGSLVTQEMVDYLKMYYNRVSFQVTIDEVGDEYGKIKRYIDCDMHKAFNRTIDACHLLIRNSVILSIRINYLDQKIKEAEKVYVYLREIFSYASEEKFLIYLAPITLMENCQRCLEYSGHLVELSKFHYQRGVCKTVKFNGQEDLLSAFNLMPKGGACRAANVNHITITANGKIFPCNRFAQYEKYSIGDVVSGIDKTSAFYKYFYSWKVGENKCKECAILPICQGGCKALKTLYKNKDFVCKRKDVQVDLLKSYYTALTQK